MAITKIVTPNSITIFANGKILVAGTTHPNFTTISDYLKTPNPDVDTLAAMFDIPKAIAAMSNGLVEVRGNEVFYNGKALHNTLTDRLIEMMREGFDISPLVNFLEKLMKNPSHRAVEGLYDFLEATHIPITPDGNFLAYKKVRSNYLDIYSGTIRNAPGDTPRVARNQVDEDPDRTCSRGLHVCSASYLDHFGSSGGGSDRVVVVEVSPEDVVAIPRDYNNAKMRCCGYKVIGEVPGGTNAASVFSKPVMSAPDLTPAPAPTAASDSHTSQPARAYQQTDRVINIDGTPVRFVLEGGIYDEDYEQTWVAHYGGDDLDEDDYDTGETNIDDAVGVFKADMMDLIETWEAEARWLDDNGNLVSRTVRDEFTDIEVPGTPPDKDDFMYMGIEGVPDTAVFVNKRQVSSKRVIY